MTDRANRPPNPESALLAEQQRYYEQRAPEYDHWWYRQGRYDLGEAGNRQWWAEVAEVRQHLDDSRLTGQVLELAGGTGTWTEVLARRASQLTVIDGSAEMLALNRARLTRAGLNERVTHQQANLLPFEPPAATFDAVFFAFWLSHVPEPLVDDFLAGVATILRPGGRLAVLDNRPGAVDRSRHGTAPLDAGRERRQLEDGRRFTIVKRFDEPDVLVARLARVGIAATVATTATHFVVVRGQRQGTAGQADSI